MLWCVPIPIRLSFLYYWFVYVDLYVFSRLVNDPHKHSVSFKTVVKFGYSSCCAPCSGICKHPRVKSREQTHPQAFSRRHFAPQLKEPESRATSLFEVQQVAVKEVLSLTWNRKSLLDLKGRISHTQKCICAAFVFCFFYISFSNVELWVDFFLNDKK